MRLLSDNPTSPKMRRTVELKVENKRKFNIIISCVSGSCAIFIFTVKIVASQDAVDGFDIPSDEKQGRGMMKRATVDTTYEIDLIYARKDQLLW